MSNERPAMTNEVFVQVSGCFRRRSTAVKNRRKAVEDFPWYY